MEPLLPEFDDSWVLDLDFEKLSEIWPEEEILSGLRRDEGSYDGVFDSLPHRDTGFWQNAPDQNHQPISNASYDLGEFLTSNSWKIDSAVQSGTSHSRPWDGETLGCLATDSILSEQPAVGSCPKEPMDSFIPPSSSKAKTRKRRRLSDFTREKAKSVRRVGACLRCRLYKEPV